MQVVFLILFLVSFVLIFITPFKPNLLRQTSRIKATFIAFALSIFFLSMIGVFAQMENESNSTTSGVTEEYAIVQSEDEPSLDESEVSQEHQTIDYEIIKQSQLRPYKISYDVRVPLVNNRLPTKMEIKTISRKLVGDKVTNGDYNKAFVMFYLPDMQVSAGAFATANHNPQLKVEILDFILMNYPQYQKLLK